MAGNLPKLIRQVIYTNYPKLKLDKEVLSEIEKLVRPLNTKLLQNEMIEFPDQLQDAEYYQSSRDVMEFVLKEILRLFESNSKIEIIGQKNPELNRFLKSLQPGPWGLCILVIILSFVWVLVLKEFSRS